ncbi:MAG: hypothetical protein HC906_08865 [Bacteroidales bacterium]|nr:hypothetical protein [Bacteroidales bacterium]
MYIKFFKEYGDYFNILIFFEGNSNYNPGHSLYELMHGHEDDPMSFFVEMLRQGIKDGSVRSDIAPEVLAHTLWSQTTGILKLAKTKDFHFDIQNATEDDIINAHIKIILNGIKEQ